MVAGGSDELTFCSAAVFDTLYATSLRNDQPSTSPVPSTGTGTAWCWGKGLHAHPGGAGTGPGPGARIYAEIMGFGTNSDGAHITQPQQKTMATTMALALRDAGLPPPRWTG